MPSKEISVRDVWQSSFSQVAIEKSLSTEDVPDYDRGSREIT